jgi:peptidoglycan/LPS O-acetylase OafA/YrhL
MATSRASVREQVGFIAPLEGMRGVAVLLVILFHYAVVLDPRFADPWLAAIDASTLARVVIRNGMLGVDLFFLITGFLLVLPWLRQAADGGPAPSTVDFYRRRANRILPAYYVHLLVLFFVLVPLLRGLEFWRYNPAYMFQNLSAHIFLVHYFTPATSASVSVNGALWSLALEAQFYLLLPLLAPVFARAPWRTAAAMLTCAIAWRWMAAYRMDGVVEAIRSVEPHWNLSDATARHLLYTQLPGYLGHFAAGMLAGRAWLRWRTQAASPGAGALWLAFAAAALAILWLLHAPGGWILGELTWVLALLSLAAAFTALVARGIAAARPLLANRPLAFAGKVSYSAYLYHLPMLLLWNLYAPAVTGSWLALPLYLGAVLAVAWISYRYVEARERDPTASAAPIASTCSAATPQSTAVNRPASINSPNAIGAIASPVSIPE